MQQGDRIVPFVGKNGGEIFSISEGKPATAKVAVWSGPELLPFGVRLDPWVYRLALALPIWLTVFLLLAYERAQRTDAMYLVLAGLAMVTLEVAVFTILALL